MKNQVGTLTHSVMRRLACAVIVSAACFGAPRVYATTDISYTLTTQNDPIKPGHVLEFDAAVRNLSASTQSVTFNFTVPQFTTYGFDGGGTAEGWTFSNVAAGETRTAQLLFQVVNSGSVPPNGTSITLDTVDQGRGASVSETVVVHSGLR